MCVYVRVCLHAHTCVLYDMEDSIWKLDRRHGIDELLHLFAFPKIEQRTTCYTDSSSLQIYRCNTILLDVFIFIHVHSKYTYTQFNFYSNIIGLC